MITKDSIIGDILDMDRNTAPYFLEIGMHCLGCPASRGETLDHAGLLQGPRHQRGRAGGQAERPFWQQLTGPRPIWTPVC